jgi:hypothetical protein
LREASLPFRGIKERSKEEFIFEFNIDGLKGFDRDF